MRVRIGNLGNYLDLVERRKGKLSENTPTSSFVFIYIFCTMTNSGRDSSVGIATRYGLDSPGIESRWGRDFPHPSRPALGPTQHPVQWVPGLSRG